MYWPKCISGVNPAGGLGQPGNNYWYLLSYPQYCFFDGKAKVKYSRKTMAEWYGISHNIKPRNGWCLRGKRYLIQIMRNRWTRNGNAGRGVWWRRSWGIPYLVEWTDDAGTWKYQPRGPMDQKKWGPISWSNNYWKRRTLYGGGTWKNPKGTLPIKPWDPEVYTSGGTKKRMTLEMWWNDRKYYLKNGRAGNSQVGCIGATGAGCDAIHGTIGSLAHDQCINHYVYELDYKFGGNHDGSRSKTADWLCGVAACAAYAQSACRKSHVTG